MGAVGTPDAAVVVVAAAVAFVAAGAGVEETPNFAPLLATPLAAPPAWGGKTPPRTRPKMSATSPIWGFQGGGFGLV